MKTVIEMAREANAFSYVKDADSTPHLWTFSPTELERLVELVRADEREVMLHLAIAHGAPWHFREAIHARSNT